MKSSLQETTVNEVLKFFGILILTSNFDFTKRASQWNTTARSNYRPAAQLGLTRMLKHSRLRDILNSI
jgi:hypothetical protein